MNSSRSGLAGLSPSLPPGARGLIIAALSVAVCTFHLYAGLFGLFSATVQRGMHWWLLGCLLFLTYPRHDGPFARPFAARCGDWLCLAAFSGASLYLLLTWESLVFRMSPPDGVELFWGGAMLLLTLEGARRCTGLFLPLTATVFLAYALLGPYMPGLLRHKGYSLSRIISYLFSTSSGIYGIPMGVSASYIILFVLFGAFLNASGTGKLLMQASFALTGRFTGGAAKTAVVASALMGMLSGSPIANAVTTGTITIPLMRKSGFEKNMACAVEAVAYTGGMIMPPVMGAAAFIMAEYLRVDYAAIMKAALLPALIYFASVYFTVDLYARRQKLGAQPAPAESFAATFSQLGHMVLPIICLVVFLVWRISPMTAVVWSLLILFAVSFIRPQSRLSPRRLLDALLDGAKSAVPVACACATSGIILGVVSLTGVGSTLSSELFIYFNSFLPGALICCMIISLVLGMGLPATAVYLILATLLAPSLINLGVAPIAAHMFVFYFGIISTITPPVALTAYAAAAVGGGDAVRVGFIAFRLGLAAYSIPFILVYAPELLFSGDAPAIALRFAFSLAAVYALALASIGYQREHISMPRRLLAAAAGLLLITPDLSTDIPGTILLLLVLFARRRRAAVA